MGGRTSVGAAFWRFWIARTAGIAGDQVLAVALAAHVYALHHDAGQLSAVMLAFAAPRLLSPVFGAVADNLDTRWTMIVIDVASALALIPIALAPGSFPIAIAVAVVITVLSTVYLPAGRRSISELAPEAALPRAYAMIGTSWNIGWALGPATGGLVLSAGGIRAVCLIDALTFCASAALMASLPASTTPTGPLRLRSTLDSLSAGTALVLREPMLRLIGAGTLVLVALASVDSVLLLVLTTTVFHKHSGGSYGVLLSIAGIGMILASTVLSARPVRRFLLTMLAGQLLVAVGFIATGLAPNQTSAGAAQLVAGFGNGTETVASGIVVQRAVPIEVLGTVSGIFAMLPYLGNVIAYSAAPSLVDATGPRTAFVLCGLLVATVAAITYLLLRRALAAEAVTTGQRTAAA